jgi:hypothetical protein
VQYTDKLETDKKADKTEMGLATYATQHDYTSLPMMQILGKPQEVQP